MTPVTGDWLTRDATQAVMAMLTDAGHQAHAVGGCVRNALLGVPVSDVDIATDARPERVMALAGAAGLKALPTGIDHGTVTVVAGGEGYEITTWRADVETDGRRAVVAFADTLAQDALRRDFTMNALYAAPDGALVDPLGGLPDLQARRVRFIEDADRRIREDYLRILRFFRFSALYADPEQGWDADTLAAIAATVDGMAQLSRERVGQEVLKLLSAPDPAPAAAVMAQTGVLAQALPGASAAALGPLVLIEAAMRLGPDPIRRLAAMGFDDSQALRLSRAQDRQLSRIHQDLAEGTGLGEIAYRHGAPLARDVAAVQGASLGTWPPDLAEARIAHGAAAVFPIAARDLMPNLSGPALGARLRDLESRWIASGFALDREALLSGKK